MSRSIKLRPVTATMIASGLVVLTACSGSAKSAAGTSTATAAPSSSVVAATATSSTTQTTSTQTTSTQTTSTQTTSTQTTASAPASSARASSSGGGKCSDLTSAAASKAIGKPTTVKATAATALAGLSICDVTVSGEVYPIQLAVDTSAGTALFAADKNAFGGVGLSGIGDQAFTSSIGVEVLSGHVDIKVTGPAGPVLNKDYTLPTAVAKAMIAALK